MEIGSFIELQFPKGLEYYSGKQNIARLNSGRTAIYHAARVLNCNTVWLPYYQCDTVRDFLKRKGIKVKYYHIDQWLDPKGIKQKENEVVVFVNYYGVMSQARKCLFCQKVCRRSRRRLCDRQKRREVCGRIRKMLFL